MLQGIACLHGPGFPCKAGRIPARIGGSEAGRQREAGGSRGCLLSTPARGHARRQCRCRAEFLMPVTFRAWLSQDLCVEQKKRFRRIHQTGGKGQTRNPARARSRCSGHELPFPPTSSPTSNSSQQPPLPGHAHSGDLTATSAQPHFPERWFGWTRVVQA